MGNGEISYAKAGLMMVVGNCLSKIIKGGLIVARK